MSSSGIGQFIPLILIFVIFYFFLIRPQQKKAKEHKQMVGNLKRGDQIDKSLDASKVPDGKASRENLYPNVEGKYMFLVTIKDIKSGEEITANYNLYTYPKTGIGIQTL